jgi:tripartite-type tricarboxylate transporter receptor subunit TctC
LGIIAGGQIRPHTHTLEKAAHARLGECLIQWGGLFAPKGTPVAVLNRLSSEVLALAQNKEVRAQLERSGADLSRRMTRAEFEQFLKDQRGPLAKLARDNNMKAE